MTEALAAAVMVFGALVAVAGIVVMVRQHTEGANRLRGFGVEFELSTPALVIFLAGCGLVVAPFLLDPDPFSRSDTGTELSGQPGADPPPDGGAGLGDSETKCDRQPLALQAEASEPTNGEIPLTVKITNLDTDDELTVNGAHLDPLIARDEAGRTLEILETKNWVNTRILPGDFYRYDVVLGYEQANTPESLRLAIGVNGACTRLPLTVALGS